MRSLWAAGMLLRRLRDELGILLLICALVGATSFVFAAAPRLFNRVSDDALRYAANVATPAQRDITLSLDSSLPAGEDGGVGGVRAYAEELSSKFPASVDELIGDRLLRVTTVRFFVPEPKTYETHVSLRYQDGITDRTKLVEGRWPVDRGVPLKRIPLGQVGDPDPEPVVLEMAISKATAFETGFKVGDRIGVTLDGSDPLVVRAPFKIVPTDFEIVGLFEATDPDDVYWKGDTNLLQVVQAGSEDTPVAYATGYIPPEMYATIWNSGLPFHYEWKYKVDPQRLRGDGAAQLQVDLRRLGLISGTAGGGAAGGSAVAVVTGLPRIIERYLGERALSESVLSIAALGPLGLAAGALGMVAILLVRRRRSTLALARGRGATGALLLGTQLWEGALFAGGAALLGLLAAILVVDARPSPLSAVFAVAVGFGAALLLVGASWSMARRPLGQLERDDTPVLKVAPRRIVIELTIVLVAVGATLLLRQRGLTVDPDSNVASADPLLASVPVLAGLAAGILALRLYPLPIRALGWLAAGGRGFVAVTGLRTIGRHPAAANLPLLVLMLTAAFGAFSSVIAGSLDRGQAVASYLDIGADYRLQEVGIGVLDPRLDPAKVQGVEAVAPGWIDISAAFARRPSQQTTTYLVAVDPGSYAAVTAGTAADPGWPSSFLLDPPGEGVGTDANPIPAILSQTLPVGSGDLGVGDTFRMTVNGHSMLFQLVEQRAKFAGLGTPSNFAIVPLNWVAAATPKKLLPPSVMWVRAPESAAAPLAAAMAATGGEAHLVSRYGTYHVLHDAPLGAAIPLGYLLALIIAAVYMAFTIIGSLVLSAARRTRDLAYLRTLGVSGAQALALTVMEHAPPVLIAIIPGVALGIGIAFLCQPGLGLATFVGTADAPLFIDWPALLIMVGALVGVVAAAVMTGTWLSRRAVLADALRIGDD
jgi:putative ABC transport system permease protein